MSAYLTSLPLSGRRLDLAHKKWPPSLGKCAKSLFNPQTPLKQKQKKKKKNLGTFGAFFGQILSLFLSKFSPKYIKKSLIYLFSQQSRGSVFALFSLTLVLGPWI